MRKPFYISIAISLIIVAAALVHYNWRASQLRPPLAQLPENLFEKSESVLEKGYFGEKCLENPMILSLK